VGQIPGSVCLPLHEVEAAFQLSSMDFLQRYRFLKPDRKSRNIVLTCRSGRRVLVADSIMQESGYQFLRIYSGSFKDWVRHNGNVIKGEFDLDYDILAA
jgi:rhodanese-related sulfurtransferase